MISRIVAIASNTFREAVRDRVLYNLVLFALLLVGASLIFGEISIGIQRQVLINLGLAAISLFGIVIAIFIGIGLVSKEIEKKTLYTVLGARPVRRWEFILGKYSGLVGTLVVNATFMAIGFFAAMLYLNKHFERADLYVLVALYFIVLQFLLITAIAIFFSTFSTPLMSSVFAFALFVIGTFSEDLRNFAAITTGATKYVATGLSWIVPNFAAFNVVSEVAHSFPIAGSLVLYNTAYAVLYVFVCLSAAVLVFERRNFK